MKLNVIKKNKMKSNKILPIFILLLGFLSCGFSKKNPEKFSSNYKLSASPEQAILGIWIKEDSPSDKLEFLPDGNVNKYFSNVFQYSDIYSISNECDGNTSQDERLFLKTISIDGTVDCLTINNLEDTKGGFLSLMNDRGQIIIYIKQ